MQGNQGILGLALMTDNTTVPAAPTIALRVTQFADPFPKYTETEDQVATGTRFGTQKFIQGIESGSKTIQATATLRDLPMLLTTLLNAPDGTGLITPRPNSYAALAPGQPLMVWQKHPLKDSVFQAAQVSALTINIPNRQNADVSVTLNTAWVAPMGTAPTFPPLAATGILQFLHFWVTIGGVKVAPESGSIEITQGMVAADGAQGKDDAKKMNILGWELDGQLTARLRFTLSESGAGVSTQTLLGLIALATPDASTGLRPTQAVEAGFKLGTDEIKFTFPNCEIMADNPPTGLGRLTVDFDAMSKNLGTAPVTVNVPVVAP